MQQQLGRRETKKLAVRNAVEQAARRLFAEQGYEATSVRQIADAAGIGERTFYRYFDGKEGLIADEAQRWMELLASAIRHRPAQEPPFLAVQRTITTLAGEIARDRRGKPIWLFTNQPRPFELLLKSAPKPLLKFEDAITNAILDRTSGRGDGEAEFTAQLIARVSIGILRSATIRQRELQTTLGANAPKIDATLDAAYDIITLQLLAAGVRPSPTLSATAPIA
jgi:AcrR family transcriptional regulator